jgi:hypothetical protein
MASASNHHPTIASRIRLRAPKIPIRPLLTFKPGLVFFQFTPGFLHCSDLLHVDGVVLIVLVGKVGEGLIQAIETVDEAPLFYRRIAPSGLNRIRRGTRSMTRSTPGRGWKTLGGRAPGHWPEMKHNANNNTDGMLYTLPSKPACIA